MKKHYIFMIVLAMLSFSCGKDFLEEDPKGVLSPDLFFSSETGIVDATATIAWRFSDLTSQAGHLAPYMGGDDLTAHPASSKQDFREIDIFNPSDGFDRLRHYWASCYATIRAANAVIDNVDLSAASQDVKDDCAGTAYFYRALSYSLLTRVFGKVPLFDKFSTVIDYEINPSEVSEIYALIISDLESAEQLLPETRTDGSYPGAKPLKGAAKAVLAQVYLTMAGWPLKETGRYELAAAKAKEVIDNAAIYGYELLPNIADLWTWANNFTNHEIVFASYFNNTLAGGWKGSMAAPKATQPQEEGGWSDYFAEISFFKAFPAGPRKDATYQTMIEMNDELIPWDDPRTYQQNPYFAKYRDDIDRNNWWGSRAQQIVRYAEVLLTYAEAKAMSPSGPDQSAYDALNAVRNRAGLPDIVTGLSALEFRDSVVAERGWEFAGGETASRWFDLVRLEMVEEANAKRDPSEIPLNHPPTVLDYWMPIPVGDVSLNPGLDE